MSTRDACQHQAGWFESDRVGIFAEQDADSDARMVGVFDFSVRHAARIRPGPAVFRVRLKCNAKCGAERFVYIKAEVDSFGPIRKAR